MTIQREINENATSRRTKGIRVTIFTDFLKDRSDVLQGVFAYSYTVNLANESNSTVQLINRHWKIFSAGIQISDVKGEGVVGEQPVLSPGEAFEYTSWAVVHDPIGSMKGNYTFVNQDGDFFDVTIPEFSLMHLDAVVLH